MYTYEVDKRQGEKMNRKKSQSILEYVIVLAAIIAAIAIGIKQFASKEEDKGLGKLMKKSGDIITEASGNILSEVTK